MKLCISTLACPQWTLDQITSTAAANGIGGIDFRGIGEEIDVTKLPAFSENLDSTVAQFRERNLSIPCFNTSITLVTAAPERWQMMLDECQRTARIAQRTGTRFLRIFGGSIPKEMSRDEAISMAQRKLRQLVKISKSSNAQILVETHDAWSTSDELLELIHEFDPNEVGVLWDIEHPFRKGEKPADTATALKRFIRHVHLKDGLRVEGKNRNTLLGEGDIPIRECVSALRSMGYDGWYCLETEKRWQADAPEPYESLPQFAQFMSELT